MSNMPKGLRYCLLPVARAQPFRILHPNQAVPQLIVGVAFGYVPVIGLTSISPALALFRFYRQARPHPCLKPSLEGMHICIAVIRQDLRHPGARCLVRSRAVHHHRSISADIRQMFFRLIGRNPYCPRHPGSCLAPGVRAARINQCDFLATT
jgi:hypothetical protein